MNKIQKFVSTSLVLCLLWSSCYAQPSDNPLKSAVDSFTDAHVKNFFTGPGAVGLSIGIYHDGKTYTYNYGQVDKDKQELPAITTLFNLASITKTMTGYLLAQASLEGKVGLNDDIRKYLSGNYPNLEYAGQPIRLYHLLNHCSGLPFFLPEKPGAFNDTSLSPNTIAARLLKNYSRADFYKDLHKVRLDTVPGYHFHYSNAAGQLCGYILEKVYGMTYEALLRQSLNRRLKMVNTTITLTSADSSRYAKGYDQNGHRTPNNPVEFQAAGAVKSTVADMLRYLEWQINEEDEAVRLSHRPTTRINNEGYSVGLNWNMIKTPQGVRAIWQDGNTPGTSSLCIFYPHYRLGIILFSNQSGPTVNHRMYLMGEGIMKAIEPGVPEF